MTGSGVTHTSRFCRCAGLALTVGLLLAGPLGAVAQPLPFGSADDPREQFQRIWWRQENLVDVMGGFSLIGAQWRAAGSATLNLVTRSFTARMSGTLRAGIYGRYEPDIDEAYDLVRLLEFARYVPPVQTPLYLRIGLVDRMRLGTGHVVDFFNSHAAWDERLVGAEALYSFPAASIGLFTEDVLFNGVTGGRFSLTPLLRASDFRARSLKIGFNYATDFRTHALEDPLHAYNVDLSLDALRSGAIRLSPFASYAWYANAGRGLALGADLQSDNFIDVARFRLRLAFYHNGEGFIPDYLGAFYPVLNPTAQICNSEKYFAEGDICQSRVGYTLAGATGGNDLLTELRLLFFERFEFWYYFRRHYGAQRLSTYHLRLFLRVVNRLRLDVGIDRGNLAGFFTLFNDLGDQTLFLFNTDYRVFGSLWVYIRARYTYEQVGRDATDPTQRLFLVQRRFEPLTGLRLVF